MDIIFITKIIGTIIFAFIVAEFVGYFLHMLLHSNKIRFLSYSHMLHHIKIYGPKDPQRTKIYKGSAVNRFNIAGIGMEWMVPIIILLGLIFTAAYFLDVPMIYQLIFVGIVVFHGWFLFSYMHSAMHIEGFWMIKNKLLKKWFLNARHLHDIHHIELSNGICFFFFDKLFGSIKKKLKPFNKKGYKSMKVRYGYLL
jgi:sterol desaturase/sphingolipid hydroxylase (fatty acid hydroxylase superfamily)